jgi:hypothetical protein
MAAQTYVVESKVKQMDWKDLKEAASDLKTEALLTLPLVLEQITLMTLFSAHYFCSSKHFALFRAYLLVSGHFYFSEHIRAS